MVSRAAAQIAGGFYNNRAHFAAIADAKHANAEASNNTATVAELMPISELY